MQDVFVIFKISNDLKGRDGNPPSESDRRRMQRIQILASALMKWFAEDTPPIQDSQQSNPEEGPPQ